MGAECNDPRWHWTRTLGFITLAVVKREIFPDHKDFSSSQCGGLFVRWHEGVIIQLQMPSSTGASALQPDLAPLPSCYWCRGGVGGRRGLPLVRLHSSGRL